MSRARRAILICYALTVAVVCLWVPWRASLGGGVTRFLGYGWVWTGPAEGPTPPYLGQLSVIDYGRTAAELLAITAVLGAAFLIVPGRASVGTVTDKSEPMESGGWTPPRLPDPSNMPEGRVAFDPKTREPLARVQDGKWVAP
jgi:hypothetical protein